MVRIYLIESGHRRQQRSVGVTADLKQRLTHHHEGKSPLKPWHGVAYFAFAAEANCRGV
jgi:predicted GIY-YIG superfamily endonuclease